MIIKQGSSQPRGPDWRSWSCLLALLLLAGCATAGRPGAVQTTAGAGTALAHGMLAFNHGEDAEAAKLFEEAVRLDPRQGSAYHWLGLAYLQLGRTREAIGQLQASLKAERPPAAGRERVRADLRAAREALERAEKSPPAFVDPGHGPVMMTFEELSFEELPRWEGRIGLASIYDSNPGLLSEFLPFPSVIAPAGEVPSDLAALLGLRVSGHPFYDRAGWSLGLSLDGNQSLHQDFGELDLSFARGLASLAWGRSASGIVTGPLGYSRVPSGRSRATVLLQGGGSATWLDGSSYLRSAEGALSLAIPEPRLGETRIELSARDLKFEDEDGLSLFRRSGSEVSLGLSQVFLLGRGGRYLRLGLAAGESRAGQVFDSTFDEARAEVSAPLAGRWTLFLLGSLREDSYENPESNVADINGPLRDDSTWRIVAATVWRIDEHLSWTLRGSHARRDSNVVFGSGDPLLDYQRTVFSFGFDWEL